MQRVIGMSVFGMSYVFGISVFCMFVFGIFLNLVQRVIGDLNREMTPKLECWSTYCLEMFSASLTSASPPGIFDKDGDGQVDKLK